MIMVPDTATVDAAFTVTLTFSKAVSALAATDIMVTGAAVGTPAMDTTVTDGTVWTVEITPTVGATSVEVGVMAAKATGTAQTVTATTPEEEEMLEAGDYLVVVRDMDSPPNFGINEPDLMEVVGYADLEELFDVGGTLQLKS